MIYWGWIWPGLDFRESSLIIAKNQRKLKYGFQSAIGFHDLRQLICNDAQGSIRKLSKYSMLIADTVLIQVGCTGYLHIFLNHNIFSLATSPPIL